jgi:hypothetical protein
MRKLVLIIILLIIFSFLLGYVLSQLISNRTEKTGITDFSIETRAICEELKEHDCYYKCHDEVFLIFAGKETSFHKSNEYVCHEEGWVDPRIKK